MQQQSPAPGWGASPYANIQVPRLPVPPAGTGLASAPAPAPRQPIIRGQVEEEPLPPAAVETTVLAPPPSLPHPSALGLAAPPSEMDWTATRQHLRELGVVSFQVGEQRGSWHFVCQMPTATAGVFHRIESGPAATEAEAVTLALAEAQRWRTGR